MHLGAGAPVPASHAGARAAPPRVSDLKELADAATSLAVAAKALSKSPLLLPQGDSKFIKVAGMEGDSN